jgi:cellulose synthase/poly-beta-1,6-N-acetylglucosamine synthase-like glycosyltransferase
MTAALYSVYYSFGLVVFLLGIQSLIFFPLTIFYEFRKKRALSRLQPFTGRVSVIVPAYNEERTLRHTLLSLLESDYPDFEIIVVNDGSTDETERSIADLVDHPLIRYVNQSNTGKAGAINAGIALATGEVVLYTDADSLFLPSTIRLMVRWFGDPKIDAVCGNDRPLYPQNALHRFLAVTTHIGTGFVRRSLSAIGCLQIISGNLGAIRKSTIEEIGGFMKSWGEDLEITFRLHQHRKRIVFDPEPQVLAECPGTLGALWRQRVRWIRSYLKVAYQYRGMFFSRRHFPFSWYLPVNFLNMGVVPVLQTALLFGLPFFYAGGYVYFGSPVDILIYLGLLVFVAVALYSILLDRAGDDLRYLPYGLLIVPISYFYNGVVIYSWWKELSKANEVWHKSERRALDHATIGSIRRQKIFVSASAAVMLVASILYVGLYQYERTLLPAPASVEEVQHVRTRFHLAIATHFDAWPDWRKAISSVTSRPMIAKAETIAIGAGRSEWAYFRWAGHERDWSNHQQGEKRDMLSIAADTFHQQGSRVAAMIDMYAPKYILDHPRAAAVRFDGVASKDQVGLVELTQGAFGRKILEMAGYLAANYQIDIISLTEIPYYSYSFNDEDLQSFRTYSGRRDWPRDAVGKIDRENRLIWSWKNELMESYLEKVAAVVHKYGKKLYVDVPVSWTDFSLEGRESGLDYRRVLMHADRIVLWNYYYLEGRSPKVSRDLAEYMARNFATGRYTISIGLWGENDHANPESLGQAIGESLVGGASDLWITPNNMLGDQHWNEIRARWILDNGTQRVKS